MTWICVGLFTLLCAQFVLHKRLERQVGLCQKSIVASLEWMKSMEAEQILQDEATDMQRARIDNRRIRANR